MQCPRCQTENPPGAKFCVECAGPLARRCPACGTEVPSTAKFCPECGGVLAPRDKPKLESLTASEPLTTNNLTTNNLPTGERRHLTVRFCDLVGSTQLAQQLDPEEGHDVLAQYQKAARTAVERWGGHVAKELGDGLLVYFGWPDACEDDPERAIRAGLAIVEAVSLDPKKHGTADARRCTPNKEFGADILNSERRQNEADTECIHTFRNPHRR